VSESSASPASPEVPPLTRSVEPRSLQPCALCATGVDPAVGSNLGGRLLCKSCGDQVVAELEAEQATPRYPLAILGGLAGAIIGAAVWSAIAVIADAEVGFIAILVGFLTGQGVKRGAGKARSHGLQIMAGGLAVAGLLIAKYMTVASLAARILHLSPFDPKVTNLFFDNFGDFFGGFDLLWLFLAIGAAYRIPAPTILVGPRR
jgi:hypothetical protein